MFCPKCNAILIQHDGELACQSGGMALSKGLERALTERYGGHVPHKQIEASSGARFTWYCPGCGVSLGGDLVCPQCHTSLRDLQRALVELHPHD